ncbi:photosystem reaction center subunit H [Methanofollis aquaemaris]|uniref:Photosystem reaction center subunit H n=1 Tax=Methanofollis aquaemaris TaxID=126734 RepID=A0A8A3S5U5_9EURY|nr:PRC-barrel domain-containing protein [Methanofollis aquaemaris]QSZ66994.1 photosystem reaction center subunit H [Methanofollis aquaemaris]
MKTQVTQLFGMNVYTEKAVYVGDVDDVLLDIDGKKIESLAVGNLNTDIADPKGHRGYLIPYRVIKTIGDIIIIRHISSAFRKAGGEKKL